MSALNSLRCLLAAAIGFSSPALAAIEIVRTAPGDESSPLIVKDAETGKVVGTFWNPATGTGDFGFSSDNAPELLWSADRAYLAANMADNNARWASASLFQALENTLKPIPLPAFPPGSATAVEDVRAASQLACDQTRAVRWQHDGTLLLSVFAATRETDDKPQVEASLWADVKFTGDTARIQATLPMEPPADSTVAAAIKASLTASPPDPATKAQSQ